jgi:hypothetical protein
MPSYWSTYQRVFRDAYSNLRQINAGAPKGRVIGPVLHLLYTSDIPQLEDDTIATFAYNTANLTVGENHEEAAI